MERYILGCCGSYPYACTSNGCVCLENRGYIVSKYDSWLESGADQQCLGDQQEYVWTTYMKQGKPYDPMNLDNFQEYLADATADYAGAEKWENLREYADKGEWEKFGRAIYFLVHDHIENKLIAEEE
jgi:hypothetical protein